MLKIMKLYNKVVMVNISKNWKNKYDFYILQFSSINNFGNNVILSVAFTNLKN